MFVCVIFEPYLSPKMCFSVETRLLKSITVMEMALALTFQLNSIMA